MATRREKHRLKDEERVGKVIGKHKMAKHFVARRRHFTYPRNAESIAAEAALDGLYVVRTSVRCRSRTRCPRHGACLQAPEQRRARLAQPQSVELKVRPVFHRTAERVRAHVLVCRLASTWNGTCAGAGRRCCSTEDPADAEAARAGIVVRRKSPNRRKAERKRTDGGTPVHSFRTLLADLATLTRNTVAPHLPGAEPFELLARPTPLQDQAFNLLGVRP